MRLGLLSESRFGSLRSASVFVVMLALLLAQTLGLLHSVLHTPLRASVHVQPAPIAGQPDHGDSQHRDHSDLEQHSVGGLFVELFSGHLSDSDCRLYDQVTHVDALVDFAASSLPFVLPIVVLAFLDGLAKARWHAQFQARGPPSSR
jgi:hypothetical protein